MLFAGMKQGFPEARALPCRARIRQGRERRAATGYDAGHQRRENEIREASTA